MMALTLDATAARRVAAENNFIAALYGGGLDEMREGGQVLRSCLEAAGQYLSHHQLSWNPASSSEEGVSEFHQPSFPISEVIVAETPDTHHS